MPTTYSPLWGGTYAPINLKSSFRKIIARELNLPQNRVDRELIRTLLGVVAGSTATKTRARVKANIVENGGKRIIENLNLVNRATTAADVTDLNLRLFAYDSRSNAYKTDLSYIKR